MIKRVYVSKCCNAKAKADGLPDFLGSKEVCTVSFICSKCGKPCDVVSSKTSKKRTKEQKRRIDFQGKLLQKLVEFFDGIIIDPAKGVILTPKKKRQLAELQKIEKELLKSKPKKFSMNSRRTR